MIIEAETNSEVGYYSVVASLNAMYLGASDTLKNALTWLMLVLAENSEYQKRCFDEIDDNANADETVNSSGCHYTNSLLLENFRMYPVGDSLAHRATEDVEIDGYKIAKNRVVFGKYLQSKNFI